MPKLIVTAVFGVFLVSLVSVQSFAQTAMSVQYGRILEIGTEQLDNSKGKKGGVVVGGLAGAYSGKGKSSSNKALRILGGAAVGGAVGGKAASGEINTYIVELLNGQTVKVAIDRGNFAIKDCVAVEANSKSANLRRVSEQFCIADVPQEYKEEHKREANECDAAKNAVVSATTEEEIKVAAMKMDILCQE